MLFNKKTQILYENRRSRAKLFVLYALVSQNRFILPIFIALLHHFYFSISILSLLKQHYIHLQSYFNRCSDSLGTSESILDERYL
jgi:hypothetical protein